MNNKNFKIYSEEVSSGYELVRIIGDIDSDAGMYVQEYLEKLLERNINNIVIDLENVSYINSRGIGILSFFLKKCKEPGGNLILLNPAERVYNILRITFLSKLFPIVDSLEDVSKIFENVEE